MSWKPTVRVLATTLDDVLGAVCDVITTCEHSRLAPEELSALVRLDVVRRRAQQTLDAVRDELHEHEHEHTSAENTDDPPAS
jgi:hypothetical protein